MGTKNNPGPFDCYAKAGPDEPIFVLRANDPTAPGIIIDWVLRNPDLKPEKIDEALRVANSMREWAKRNQTA